MKNDSFTALLFVLVVNFTSFRNISYNSYVVLMHVFAETCYENVGLLQNFIILTQLNKRNSIRCKFMYIKATCFINKTKKTVYSVTKIMYSICCYFKNENVNQ